MYAGLTAFNQLYLAGLFSQNTIAVRLRLNKKVQNLNEMWYESFAKHIAT
jgi:hypothetical protein